MADRSGQRVGAAYAGPFGAIVHNNANQAKPEDDGLIIRQATVAALDSALMQLAAVWGGEQLTAHYRQEAEANMKKAQDDAKKGKKRK
jgi:hypothetical protein